MSSLQLERLETEVKPASNAPSLPYQGSQLEPNQMPLYHAATPQPTTNPPSFVPTQNPTQPTVPPTYPPVGIPQSDPIQGAIEDMVSGVEGMGREIGAALGLNRNQPSYTQQPEPRYAQHYQPPYPQPDYQIAPPIQQQTYQQGSYTLPYRTPSTAFLLELLGYGGFLGIGHIYAGNVIGGILMLVFGWALVGLAYVILSILSLGLGFIILLPVLLAVPIISGVWAYRIAEANNRRNA
jgi:hypothetical protein